MATTHTHETEEHGRLGPNAKEIVPERWKQYLDDLSRDHVNQTVSVEIRSETMGAHWLAENAHLIGLVAGDEPKDSIEIILGTPETGPFTHVVGQAVRFWEQRNELGRQMLQIDSADGTATIVTLLS